MCVCVGGRWGGRGGGKQPETHLQALFTVRPSPVTSRDQGHSLRMVLSENRDCRSK